MRTIYRVEAGWCSQHAAGRTENASSIFALNAPVDPWAGQPLFPSWYEFYATSIA